MQQKSELPEGWVNTTISEVGKITTGNTPPKIDPKNYGNEYPWVKPGDLDKNVPITETEESLSEKGASLARLLPINTVLVSCIGNLGKLGIAGTPLATNQQINSISFEETIVSPKYGYYYCKTLKNWLESNYSATTIPIINKTRFSEAPFYLPPLPEQHRIVLAIEALFTHLDATNEKLGRVQEILKKFRQSVLSAACDGRLTAEWRKEYTNKDDVLIFFESIKKKRMECWEEENLEKLFFNGKMPQNDKWKQKYKERESSQNFDFSYLPDEWISVTVDQVALKVTDGDHNPPKRVENGIPHLTAKNIKNWKITLDNCTYISPDDFEVVKTRYNPQKDDLIITCVGTIGETALVPDNLVFSADRNLAVIRLTEKGMDPKFLQYTLNASLWKDIIKKGSSSTAQPHFYLKDIRALTIPLPSRPEQQEIVRRVDALFAFADSVEAKVALAREKTEKLRQSILTKAFTGELVPTEAELARREGRNYESAEILLERIKAEKSGIKR